MLDKTRSRFLGELTFKAAERLAGDALCVDPDGELRNWRTARVLDLLLVDQAADERAPRAICVYFQLEAQDMGLGKRLKIAPERLLYAVNWLHKGKPPDLGLAFAPSFQRAPDIWFDFAAGALLGKLQEADPSLRERLAAVAASP
jgi:hypothetical protein